MCAVLQCHLGAQRAVYDSQHKIENPFEVHRRLSKRYLSMTDATLKRSAPFSLECPESVCKYWILERSLLPKSQTKVIFVR